MALGLAAHEIDYRVKTGRLIPLHRGVYAVGHRPPSPQARAMAAVLACGPSAVPGRRSAAALWGITRRWDGPVEVIAASGRTHRGIEVIRSSTVTPRDVTVHYGMPVTSLARTVLDLADVLPDRQLARAVNEARLKQRSVLNQLEDLIARSPGRATSPLKRFTKHAGAPTKSVFEDAFLAFVEHHGLPQPMVNETVAGHEVDMSGPTMASRSSSTAANTTTQSSSSRPTATATSISSSPGYGSSASPGGG